MKHWAKIKERLSGLMREYGQLALGTYFGLFFLTWGGFALAITCGFHMTSAAGNAGVLGASYLAAKVTQPLRIWLTLLITPLVARVLRRPRRETKPEAEAPAD